MTLIEELRQASLTALDHRDLLERAAADAERKDLALRQIATVRESSIALGYCIGTARAALSTQGEKT